ncbi:alpha-amylase family glycosyl hydrolase [Frankia sp. AgB32]|uniref:alpha-amylase family glycosyl hydrolase n=1 Tax=Frankia sp. AgB32 TaxID=631119 RepID=UPI00200E0424|nr:alpha-amylase family glycosyl hydrolase [Frankia sp. AgB32]MCK9894116.1 alpha-amylase family glycosyl hydrolase [Frankia sp. AgB32]
MNADREPAWVRHAVWWHVYPLGFTGADTTGADRRPAHRLRQLVDWLDYAVRLGANGLALGPIFASSTHGYDTLDHLRIDPRLGDDADFDDLVAQCHARGLRVLLDGVFNHVGRAHPAFVELLDRGEAAPHADWFVPTGGSGADGRRRYATFEGHDGLVTLAHANPAVADHITDVMVHWLDRGADGWRLDAAYAVPAEFWARVLPRVRRAHPQAYLVGEVIHGDYPDFVRRSGLAAVTQYELWKSVWSALNDTNLFELDWTLRRHNDLLDTFVPLTFVGNHDVTRLASRLREPRHLPHALVVLCTVGGTPSVYYGDEQAFTGVKEERVGGDDAIRPAFPAGEDGLAAEGWPTFRLHQQLIGLRRRHPWLHRAKVRVLHLAGGQLTYETSADGQRLLVALNLAGEPADCPAPGAGHVLGGAADLVRARGGDTVARLAPFGWAVLAPAA